MQSLVPYDTSSSGYITTLALCYIGTDLVNYMASNLSRPESKFHHFDPSSSPVFQLVSLIDPTFSLVADPSYGGGGTGTGNPSATSSPSDISDLGPSSQSSVNPTTVGAAVGAVGGAALYGAIMFFVARRYRQRRNVHSRSSSVIDTSSMSQTQGEMMTGAGSALIGGRGYSGDNEGGFYGTNGRTSRGSGRSGSSRGRDISAPMMAENSLGWN